MSDTKNENNVVFLSGIIEKKPEFSHEIFGEGFYCLYLSVKRLSDSFDSIPVTVSERLTDLSQLVPGKYVQFKGQFRSHNSQNREGQIKLLLSVFALDVTFPEEVSDQHENSIELKGYICKQPVYRKTPFNREITDILLAVNRSYNKSDYIPCICWGRNARFGGKLQVGSKCRISGRLQSRVFQKKLPDGSTVDKTAYEVSVSRIETWDNEDENRENINE